MVPTTQVKRGPKGIPVATHNLIATKALNGVPAPKAIEELRQADISVSQTKVYEIYRNPILKPVPDQEAAA